MMSTDLDGSATNARGDATHSPPSPAAVVVPLQPWIVLLRRPRRGGRVDDDDDDDDDGGGGGGSSPPPSGVAVGPDHRAATANNRRRRRPPPANNGRRDDGGGVLHLLHARSLAVGSSNNNGNVATTPPGCYESALSYAGAWNPRRMQNMTLAVGPGTPAWNVDVSDGIMGEEEEEEGGGGSWSAPSAEDEEEDEEEDEDGEEEDEEEEEGDDDVMSSEADHDHNNDNDNDDEEEARDGNDDGDGDDDDDDDDDDDEGCVPGSGMLAAGGGESSSADATGTGGSPPRRRRRRRRRRPDSAAVPPPSVTQSPGGGVVADEEGRSGDSPDCDDDDDHDDDHDDDDDDDEVDDDHDDDDDEVDEDEDDDHEAGARVRRWMRRRIVDDDDERGRGGGDDDVNDDDDDVNDDDRRRTNLLRAGRDHRRRATAGTGGRGGGVASSLSSSSSMRHGGCINTASWLDAGWRISTICQSSSSSSSSYSSSHSPNSDGGIGFAVSPAGRAECPTQLLTSGDDVLVKFWDVSMSMGGTSPLPGGSATVTPFSSPRMTVNAEAETIDVWRRRGSKKKSSLYSSSSSSFSMLGGGNDGSVMRRCLPGTVHPLATLRTGHRGNVFHASPVPGGLGKVATCGADGYLRLHDVAVQATSPNAASAGRPSSSSSSSNDNNAGMGESSAIVVSPQSVEGGGSSSAPFFRSASMCFTFHFLSSNVGLLCSERGLLHFDIRLPPRSQRNRSIVPELGGTCKACHPWRVGGGPLDDCDGDGDGELESAYVFAGGSNDSTVGMYDLRMTGSFSSLTNHVVQRYRPRALRDKSSSSAVAVSGIDVSKDRRELLVSYESDQVYTFPIFGGTDHPTLLDIEESTSMTTHTDGAVSELAAYGGHLNRLTFLKTAKYAGPNDEYICTGSDSGHAWIYEKKSGSVVSLIKADTMTCNGIQPHPTLPIFVTYGIDSTAKLWRATSPVDMDVDDSDLGRYNYHSKQVKYQKSIVVDQWKKVFNGKEVGLGLEDDMSFFPDEVCEDDSDDQDHFVSHFLRSLREDTSFIGNDMMNLSYVVSNNYFTCARSIGQGNDEPVKSGVAAMKSRVSLIKLRHQADMLGLDFNSETPWIFKHKERMAITNNSTDDGGARHNAISYGCLADLIPDNPSDWLPFDELLANPPHPGGMKFNAKCEGYNLDSSTDRTLPPINRRACRDELGAVGGDVAIAIDEVVTEASDQSNILQAHEQPVTQPEKPGYDPAQAWDMLLQTVSLLKDAGNEALKASLPYVAARRYDQAIRYCSVAYIEFPVGTVSFLTEHQNELSKNSGYEVHWTDLLKVLIAVRLNLALVYLVQEISDANGAVSQASLSLKELKPFATKRAAVLVGKKLAHTRSDEPHSTYLEAKALQAKAYFRLGSAQLALSEYDEAVKTFEHCVTSTKEANLTVDAGVLRKINEAKRFRKEKKESQRKKFKLMFSAKNGI